MSETRPKDRASGILSASVIVILCLIIATLIVFILGDRRKAANPAVTARPPESPAAIVTIRARTSALADTLYLPGRIEPALQADLAAEKAGIVTGLAADKGDRIEKGQVLLTLDDRLWRTAFQQAEIELREAGKELTRWQKLKSTGAVSGSDYDRLQTRYDMAELACSNAQINLSKCELKSPIAGTIKDRLVELGEQPAEGQIVFRAVNIDHVKIAVAIPERDVLYAAPGREMAFDVDAAPGAAFTGKVAFVSAAASKDSNTFLLELYAANLDHRLRPGMIARVILTRKAEDHFIMLPLSAILPKKGDYVVFVVEKGVAIRRLVKIERIRGDAAIISSGIRDGEAVVIEGNRTLADGMPVSAREQAE